MKKKLTEGIRSFTRLSVRDQTTKEWVERWLGKPGCCAHVIDPTLLNPYFVERGSTRPVVAVYGEHFTGEYRDIIVRYAREKGYSLTAISWPHDWCDTFLDARSASDVQRAFGSAAYCAVSTFHGTVFSLLAHRPFVSFMSELRGAKISALLTELGLADRIYRSDMKGKLPETDINYDRVEDILAERRSESLAYLESALEDVRIRLGK